MEKRALIIGFGASGEASYQLLSREGYTPYVFDDAPKFQHPQKIQLNQIEPKAFELAILSPGVAPTHQVCQRLTQNQIPIRGEADFALSFLPQKKIAITGTNGKTTVTYLCEHILNQAGLRAIACGNVAKDRSLSKVVLEGDENAILVVELSSFQLETLTQGLFEAGVILNITPDHLDRYRDMEDYAASKFKLAPYTSVLYVYYQTIQEYGHLLNYPCQVFGQPGELESLLSEIDFSDYTQIDKLNTLAAYSLLKELGVDKQVIKKGLVTFKKPHHRFEFVTTVSGIDFINDSKATNIDAVTQALKSLEKPTILLAGGVDKGHPYTGWAQNLKQVKKIIAFGEAKEKIVGDLGAHVACQMIPSMMEAVEVAYQEANRGEQVLLSPGCSSFDEFKDYADRGAQFCKKILTLQPKETGT